MYRQPFCRLALVTGLAALLLALAACGAEDPPGPADTSPTLSTLAASGAQTAVIVVERAVVFPQPDRNAPPLTHLFQREEVSVLGQSADSVFWQVTVDGQNGWILAAQADLAAGAAPLPVIELIASGASETPPAHPTSEASPQPAATSTPFLTPTGTPTDPPTPRPTSTPRVTPSMTPFPPPTSTALVTPDDESITPTSRAIWPGTPPPLTLDLPAGWQAAHILLPFRTPVSIRDVPMSLYEGALPGGASGHLFLFWGFPNVTGPSGEVNLWTDALQILRGSLVDQSCNLGIDLEPKTYTVGGREAVGTLFSAVECEGEPDTAGYFAALQVDDGNYAFFFAVEPPGAFADQLPALQAILDSVRFEPAPESAP